MKIPFASARFLTSALAEPEWPLVKGPQGNLLPEIAFVGRSNVGKSSLINALTQQKGLAKTSSIPGKTQRMNFFLIDEKLLLVDLPGYGYAKAPKTYAEDWSKAIDAYFTKRGSLRLLILLIDSRRELSPEDHLVIHWAEAKSLPLLLVFTKTDKLSSSELIKAKLLADQIAKEHIFFHVKDKKARDQLASIIQKRIFP